MWSLIKRDNIWKYGAMANRVTKDQGRLARQPTALPLSRNKTDDTRIRHNTDTYLQQNVSKTKTLKNSSCAVSNTQIADYTIIMEYGKKNCK